MTLQVAIVGCGRMGRERAGAARQLGARVSLLYDNDPTRARELAEEHPGSRVVADPRSLDWSALQAVFVCTPPFARGPVEAAAVEAGVPFFLEKPVGLAAEQCLPLLDALARRPIVHGVGYMNRYRLSVDEARDRLRGRQVLGVQCRWIAAVYSPSWWLQAEGSGGPFNEQCTHLVDLCRYLLGEIVEVTALGRSFPGRPELDGTVAVALRLAGGQCGTVFYSCLASQKDISLEVLTTEGPVKLSGWNFQLVEPASGAGAHAADDVFLREVAAFFAAILQRDQGLVRCGLEDALRTQRVVDAVLHSRRTGRTQPVPCAGPAAPLGPRSLRETSWLPSTSISTP